jgi:sugar phosphate isomerase/epimerase
VLIGAMNHPMRDLVAEIRRFRELGFDFVDLTLEPEKALPDRLVAASIETALRDTGLGVVGHTAWYLPIASPFERVRQSALDELTVCLDLFARLGVERVNLHPDQRVPSLFPRDWVVQRNVDSLRTLLERARERGLQLMLENIPGPFNQVEPLRGVFDALPELGWHLDVGHANLGSPANVTPLLLEAFRARLRHVHFSDNKGGDADLHLPLGVGLIDWHWAVGQLKKHGYDDTITLEVFVPDDDYLVMSQRKLRRLWDETE